MSNVDRLDLITPTGPGHADPPPSCGDETYAGWVEQHQLSAAARVRRRDRRRLARALRQAGRLRQRSDRAWERVRQAERRVGDAAPAQ